MRNSYACLIFGEAWHYNEFKYITSRVKNLATKKEETYVGLDIGSSKVTCVVGLRHDDFPLPSVIGLGVAPVGGVRKGVIVDVEEVTSSISAAVEEAERLSGVQITGATITIDGAHVTSFNSRGVIAVGRADQEITQEDLYRAEEAASAIQIPSNREILALFARSYTVDDQDNIADPVGMNGVRLEVETHIITISTPMIKNLTRAVAQAGFDIHGQILVPLAAARSVLSKKQKELGVALVDIGASTTGIAIFEDGHEFYTTILPIGAGHITNDLAIGLRTSVEIAEQIKLEHVTASPAKAKDGERVRIDQLDQEDKMVERRLLNKIVEARLDEIFQLIKAELKKVGKDSLLPAGVVLTGGGAKMSGLDEFAKNSLKLPAIIGRPSDLSGLVEKVNDPAMAAPVGAMLMDADGGQGLQGTANARIGQTVDRLKRVLKNFLP